MPDSLPQNFLVHFSPSKILTPLSVSEILHVQHLNTELNTAVKPHLFEFVMQFSPSKIVLFKAWFGPGLSLD